MATGQVASVVVVAADVIDTVPLNRFTVPLVTYTVAAKALEDDVLCSAPPP